MSANTTRAIGRSIAVAAIAVAVASWNVSGAVAGQPQAPERCSGSPLYAEWACEPASGGAGNNAGPATPRQADADAGPVSDVEVAGAQAAASSAPTTPRQADADAGPVIDVEGADGPATPRQADALGGARP